MGGKLEYKSKNNSCQPEMLEDCLQGCLNDLCKCIFTEMIWWYIFFIRVYTFYVWTVFGGNWLWSCHYKEKKRARVCMFEKYFMGWLLNYLSQRYRVQNLSSFLFLCFLCYSLAKQIEKKFLIIFFLLFEINKLFSNMIVIFIIWFFLFNIHINSVNSW